MPLIAPPPGPGVDLPGPVSAPHAQLEPVPGPSADSASPPVLDRAEAEELGRRIQQQAALIAQATCEFLLLLADFDRREGSRWYVGLKSTAHWLGWACSMAAGTAREHLRVARALPELPLTVAEFRAGRLSYSKVREITRVADRVDEEVLVEMARAMTASQLARTVSSFRAVDGTRLDQDSRREARWRTREDGMVEIRAVLPAETGAELVTALELALDRDGSEPPSTAEQNGAAPVHGALRIPTSSATQRSPREATLDQRRADALHDLARSYLSHEPADRSGEDRHLVIVQVSADALRRDVPPGTSRNDESPRRGDSPRCGILDGGPLEPATAERLACTGMVSLAIADADGEILHLGRSRRLASRAQRRALRLRDGTCTFPGCHQRKHRRPPPRALVRGRADRSRPARAAVPSPPCDGPRADCGCSAPPGPDGRRWHRCPLPRSWTPTVTRSRRAGPRCSSADPPPRSGCPPARAGRARRVGRCAESEDLDPSGSRPPQAGQGSASPTACRCCARTS